MLNQLTDSQIILLARLATKEAKGRKLQPGLHNVAPFDVSSNGGEVSVGQDEPYTPTPSIPLLSTMVVALHRAGIQRDGIAKIIVDSATIAIGKGGKVGEELETTISYVQGEVKALQARLSEDLPNKVRAGKVKVKAR